MRAVIIGAGPTGLGAAWALERAGVSWTILEKEGRPGGLATSYCKDGFTWDIGGHVLFSHYPEFDRMLEEITTPDQWCYHERKAYIRIRDQWVPYPFQYNIRYLSQEEQRQCMDGVRVAALNAHSNPPANFREWIYQSMGDGLAQVFMIPYNQKVWAGPPEGMSVGWVGERVAIPDLKRMEQHLRDQTDDAGWGPNNLFKFPRVGGTGFIWQQLADRLPGDRLLFNRRVLKVDSKVRTVIVDDGSEYPYDVLISTMPIDQLVKIGRMEGCEESVGKLVRTKVWVGGIGIRGQIPEEDAGKCWMYFPEPEYPFYRVTSFSHYSPQNAPPHHYSLMVESSFRAESPVDDARELLDRSVKGLRRCGLIAASAEVVHTWSFLADYGYPVPAVGRDEVLSRILPDLESRGIYSRGRFGGWKYEVSNMDHSFMQGFEMGQRIAHGSPERTYPYPDLVNAPRKA
jgi:protoporphyrinogen oxidase